MKANWVGIGVVAVAVVAVLAYKGLQPRAAAPSAAASPTLIMVADPAEADSKCGCGEIIRAVRAAAAKGVAVRESAPGSDPSLEKKYGISVTPTVLLLDRAGAVTTRFEGEDGATLSSLHAALDRLPK